MGMSGVFAISIDMEKKQDDGDIRGWGGWRDGVGQPPIMILLCGSNLFLKLLGGS